MSKNEMYDFLTPLVFAVSDDILQKYWGVDDIPALYVVVILNVNDISIFFR